MRPTLTTVFLFGAGIVIALAAVLIDAALWPVGLIYLGGIVVALGIDASRAVPPARIRIDIDVPGILYVADDRDVLKVMIEPIGAASQTWIDYVVDVGPTLTIERSGTVVAAAGRIGTVEVTLRPTRRGRATIERIWLRWTGPMGLMRHELIKQIVADIPVIANVRAVRDAALQLSAVDALSGLKPQRHQGEGSEFEALREYTPGLDQRAIDWKHSARHRALICKEFRAERNHQIVIAFDTGYLMREPLNGIAKIDHAINAGLLLSYAALRTGDRVGLFGFDEDVHLSTDFVSGTHQFGLLQRAATGLDYSRDETNFTLGLSKLLARLRRRSLVVLLTDFVDSTTAELMIDHLTHLVSRHLVLFVTFDDPELNAAIAARPTGVDRIARAVIADGFARERQLVLRQLTHRGIHCLESAVDSVGPELINRYIAIKRLELI